MNSDDWELELNRMLDSFDCQASTSLEKISERFAELGRPFDNEFRQHFLKMSNLRLDLSFTKIELKHWNKSRVHIVGNQNGSALEYRTHQTVSNPSTSARDNEHANHKTSNSDLAVENDDVPLMVIKNENRNDLIEIIDSDDESAFVQSDRHEAIMKNAGTIDENGSNASTRDNNDDGTNTDGNTIKEAPVASVDAQLLLVTFDPNQNFDGSDKERGSEILMPHERQGDKTRKSRPSTKQNQNKMKRNDGKRKLKCKQCGYATNYSNHLKAHQKVHVQEKVLGVARDSNNLYQCTHCVRQFIDIGHLSLHVKSSHKNDQYLYDCARCMRQFLRKAEKDRHESQCEGRYFQCHLCKVFATGYKCHMQRHMQTHSGVKPVRCMVCDKSFRQKYCLQRHFDAIHGC